MRVKIGEQQKITKRLTAAGAHAAPTTGNPPKGPLFSAISSCWFSESVLKVPKQWQVYIVISVTVNSCDSCVEGALGKRTVSRRVVIRVSKVHSETNGIAANLVQGPPNGGGFQTGAFLIWTRPS